MRARAIAAVFRAELASVVRDRRTLMTSLLVPVLLYPIGGLALSTLVTRSVSTFKHDAARVCLSGAAGDVAAIAPALASAKFARVGCAADAVPGGPIDAIVDVPAGAAAALARGDGIDLAIRYDSSNFRGPWAEGRLDDALSTFGRALVSRRVADAHLPARWASPLSTHSHDVAPPAKEQLFAWAPALIFFLIFFSILGVFLPAIDLTAGDRERATLETLLTSPSTAAELMTGKFGVVFAIGMATTALNVASLFGTLAAVSSVAHELHIAAPLGARLILTLVAATAPAVALAGAVSLAVGCLARSFRDAQNFLTPVYLSLLLPAYTAAFPDVQLTVFKAAIPILNLSLTMRDALAGTLSARLAILGAGVDVIFCAAALLAATALYGHEGIAFADAEPLDLLRRPGTRSPALRAGEGISLFAVVTALVFYVGIPLQARLATAGLAASEIALVALPPILWIWWRRIDARSALALAPPRWRGALGGVLFGAACWLPLALFARYVQDPVFPMPPEAEKAIRDAVGIGTLPVPLLFLAGALLPAVCEEILFRGAILQSLRGTMGKWAIVLTAFLFAILHLDPWRLVSTFALGLMAGLIVWQTGSLFAGVLFHLTNNVIAVALSLPGFDAEKHLPWWSALAASACLPIATWLLFGPGAPGGAGGGDAEGAPPVEDAT